MPNFQALMQARVQRDLFEDISLIASVAKPQDQQRCLENFLSILRMNDTILGKPAVVEPQIKGDVQFVGSGAWEAVALSIIPGDAGFMISRGGCDRYVVSIVPNGAEFESTSSGSTLLLAVVSALALAVVESSEA